MERDIGDETLTPAVEAGPATSRPVSTLQTKSYRHCGNIMTNPHASGHMDAFRDNVITILKSIIEQGKVK
jgi:hypothetical protein